MAKMKIHYPQWKAPVTQHRAARRAALTDAIALTAEACGHPLSMAAAEVLAEDLSAFDETAILGALARCRLELDGPLRAAGILARIDDGRPDADEAWSMLPMDEQDSVVWTEEMAQAWGAALPQLVCGDIAAARETFRAAYGKQVIAARTRRRPPHWTPSLGRDLAGREQALRDAVIKGRIAAAQAEMLLGHALGVPEPEECVVQQSGQRLH